MYPYTYNFHVLKYQRTTIEIDESYTYTIHNNTFSDIDGGEFTLSIDQLPDGISFDDTNNTLSGTPTTSGTTDVTVTADDGIGGTGTDTFTITVNSIPVVDNPIPDKMINKGEACSYTIPDDTFYDGDGDVLTLSVDKVPDGISFDDANNTFSGVPNKVGKTKITVTADDGKNGTCTDVFIMEVINPEPDDPAAYKGSITGQFLDEMMWNCQVTQQLYILRLGMM